MKEWALGLFLTLILIYLIKLEVKTWFWIITILFVMPYFLGVAVFEILGMLK
jgi:hypothetical protein